MTVEFWEVKKVRPKGEESRVGSPLYQCGIFVLCCSFEEWEGCLRSLQCKLPTQHLFQYRAKPRETTNKCWSQDRLDAYWLLPQSPMQSYCRSDFITDIQPVGVSSCRFPLWARDRILCPLDFCGFVFSGNEPTGIVLAETKPKDCQSGPFLASFMQWRAVMWATPILR